ncbi:Flp pilus assembly pilin Flp [Loktanella ponticola]|uniref:Flp pilus assembly pilin Flp n=1 Tax=Yoonia ponticola TaxID=1524255 RepID=A0A7W9BLD2_9RHOB|nr:hypothetical protein [Yoonia ponticola]MBB5722477.1 Flp pilus assembly pilin Flp [Yoonia ponticola]
MKLFFEYFSRDEDGAVTVDWVVLTAAVVILAAIVFAPIQTGAVARTSQIVDVVNESGNQASD